MALSRFTVTYTLNADGGASGTNGVEDWALDADLRLRGGRPVRLMRIDTDVTDVDASAYSFEVDDQDGVSMTATGDEGSPVLFWTNDDNTVEHEGTLVGTLSVSLADFKEDDVIVFHIWYDHTA